MRLTSKPSRPAPEPEPPEQDACWVVHGPGERWLAGRTLRALAARGIVGVEVPLAVLPDRLAGTRRAWLLRAGALPARLPALPASRGVSSLYVGVEVSASGEPAPGWQALIEGGGRLEAQVSTLPRWVVVHVDSPAALADALRREPSMEQALALAAETQRTVVASGIRAQWSAQVRVGLLIGTLHRGGAERIALDLAEHLPRLGVATRLVACFAPKRESFVPPRDATLLYERAAPDADRVALAADDFSRWGADIVHAHLMDAQVLRRLTALSHGVVTTAHNARGGWPAGLGALSTCEAELVIGCSLATTRELQAAGVSAPVRTAWNGVARLPAPAPDARTRRRAALGIAADALVLVSVANDRPQKRLQRLGPILEALARRGLDAQAVQIGSRPDARLPETIAAGAAPAPAHPRLHFVGAQERVADWLAAADVFVATSAHEGLSLSQLEALGAGLPVVATITGGHDELSRFAPGYVGLPQDASDDDFADAVVAAVRAAASVRPVAVERLSTARMAARHAQLYRDVVAARHARGRGLLVVSNNYATGGAQASARRFALATQARGVRCGVGVLFETDDALSDASRTLQDAGVPLWAPTAAQRTGPRALAEAAVAFVRGFDPAAVVFWNANVEVKLRIADALPGLPAFDVSPGEMYFAELDRYFAKPAADLPCLSQRDYGALLAGVVVKYGDEAARAAQALGRPVSVVPNGLPMPAAPERDLARRGHTIGTLARINPDKKLEQLLAAFALASARDPALELLVGGAPDKNHADYADQLRRDSAHLRVRWLGQVRPEQLFARIALFVLVAEPAGCPNASLEAMAAGLPVLATNAGGMAEQVVPGETGWLVARGDVDALAVAMAAAVANPATLTSFGLRARARARQLFSVDRMVDDYLRVTGLAPTDAAQGKGRTMAYDSGGSFDDIDMGRPGGFDADAAAPAGAASAATGGEAVFLATEAAAMAGASVASEPAGRGGWVGGDGWDAPAPSAPSDGTGLGVFRFFDDDDTYFDRDDDGFLQRSGYMRRRDTPTWSERVGRWFGFGGPRTPTARGRALAEAALRAYTLHPDACHQSTAEVAAEFGVQELDGLAADEQIKAMAARWRAVSGDVAAALANDGTLVVAALALPGNAAHDAVVVPGDGVRIGGRVYPNVCGGGYPFRRSDGSKTAADVWTPRERELVRFFTPA